MSQESINAGVRPDSACPNNPAIACPAMTQLIRLYVEDNQPRVEAALPEACSPRYDGGKLALRLAEYERTAHKIDCQGPSGPTEQCPARIAMDQNVVRKTGVQVLRKTLNIVRGR